MDRHNPDTSDSAGSPDTDSTELGRPERSEKRPARDEISEIAPGVLRSELPVELPGLGHVNMYILEDGDGVAVVDPGLPGEDSWKALVHRLGAAGYKVSNVHSIVVTHSHYDHYGGAYRLVEESGARIIGHPQLHIRTSFDIDDDLEMLDVDDEAPDPARDSRYGHWTPWGTWSEPPEEVIRHWQSLGIDQASLTAPRAELALGDEHSVMLARREWVAVHTPGHTADHLCLYDPEAGLMITGDHVLPTITPHISGYSHADDPLQRFFDSLNRMHDFADVRLALPAHGDPFDDLSGRSSYIHDHHVERLDDLRDAATEIGHASVESYMRQIFRERSWGNMASSETFAHLDHLKELGELTVDTVDGQLWFRPQ